MVYKTEKQGLELYEIIYSETGAEYGMRHMKFEGGKILTELLAFDFDKFNVYIKENMSEVCKNGYLYLNDYKEFGNLSEETRFLLLYTSELRFLAHRSRLRHGYNVNHDYFVQLNTLLKYVKETVDIERDSEEYFRFYFKYYLRVLATESIYESKHDLNILNYIFPVAYAYAKEMYSGVGELETLLSKAEENREKVSNIIEFVPEGNQYYDIMQVLKKNYWIDEQKRYRAIPIPFNKVIDEFDFCPEIQQKFISCVYEYDILNNGKVFVFKSIEEYIALAVLEYYKKGCPICKCKECNKYFVRLSNSRRLCGSKECLSKNKRHSAAQRKSSLGVNDNNILNAVYKALCYSSYATETPRYNLSAYVMEDEISEEVSAAIVSFLDKEIYRAYRDENKKNKARIKKLSGEKREKALLVYQMWLKKIKTSYSHQKVLNSYRKSNCADITSKEHFMIDYYKIENLFDVKDGIVNIPKEIIF